VKRRFILSRPIPYRVPHRLPAIRLACRIDLPEVLLPFNGILARAPWGAGLPPRLRFRPQVFSTSRRFPSKLEFHGPVSCRNRSWDSSFRAFPSQKSRTPLEAASSPAVIHRRAARTHRALVTTRFRRRPRSLALAWLPRTAMESLSADRSRRPVPPGPRRTKPCVPPASPTSELSSSCESVHDGLGFPAPPAVALLDFCPSEVFSSRASDPRPVPPKGGTPHPSRRSGVATRRTLRPLAPGGPSPCLSDLARTRRRSPAPFEAGPHRLSAASPTPSALVQPAEADLP
jgi:hypothetical protein